MAWFKRERTDAPGAPAPSAVPLAGALSGADPSEKPEALREQTAKLVRHINRNAGRLPVAAVVAARRLTDTLLETIDTSDVRALDVYAIITIKSTLGDYLPTTLDRYLALDPDLVDVPRPSGATPRQSLLTQIADLQTSADTTLEAVRNQDVDALMAQGSFLAAKFSRSDLEL